MSARAQARGKATRRVEARSSSETVLWARLFVAASGAAERAYAPYSDYSVGAALRTASGRVFAACNVENASFGLCLCAERAAVAQAIAAGERAFTHLMIVSHGKNAASPCGMCRQTLLEFCADLPIRVATVDGRSIDYRLGALLPAAFDGEPLKRTTKWRK